MKLKKKLLVTLGIILAIILVSGVSIYAATSYGSQSDPLVTLGYVNKVKDDILNQSKSYAKTESDKLSTSFDATVKEAEKTISSQLSSGSVHSTADVYSVVTLSANQTVMCDVGCEIMLRIGSVSASGDDSPVLIDTTTAEEISNGKALVKNHLYMVTIDGNGIQAGVDGAKILIRGTYTVN